MADLDEFTDNDWTLLYGMVLDRIKAAEADGLPDDHPSSVYRQGLLDKITKRLIEARKRDSQSQCKAADPAGFPHRGRGLAP